MRFTKKQMEAAIAAVSKDETRASICVLRIEPGALVATDGHRLHRVVTDPTTSTGNDPQDTAATADRSILVPLAECKRIVKAMDARDVATVAMPTDDPKRATVTLHPGGTVIPIEVDTDVEFPSYRNVMPTPEAGHRLLEVNPHYLRELADAAIKAGAGTAGPPFLRLWIPKPHAKTINNPGEWVGNGVLCEVDAGPDGEPTRAFQGVLMPARPHPEVLKRRR